MWMGLFHHSSSFIISCSLMDTRWMCAIRLRAQRADKNITIIKKNTHNSSPSINVLWTVEIHWWSSDVMLNFLKSVLNKKNSLWWVRLVVSTISTNFNFWVNYSFNICFPAALYWTTMNGCPCLNVMSLRACNLIVYL